MKYACFKEIPPTYIKAKGHLLEFLHRQKKGLSGHFQELGYPYDTAMWDGGITEIKFREHEYNGRPLPVPLANAWWPYEQTAYLLDGLVRLGLLLDDRECLDLFKRNLDYVLSHAENGRLGALAYGFNSEWPMAVFFRGVKAYCEATEDGKTVKAFHRHFKSLPEQEFSRVFRNITNLEGMLSLHEWTGDDDLLEKAVRVYEQHNEFYGKRDTYDALYFDRMLKDPKIIIHGVSMSEELKLPVLLFLHTGDRKWLDGAMKALMTITKEHMQIGGVPATNEFTTGRDPLQGYETCVISDFTWTLGYFLMATPDGTYADMIEKIIYNALPGSITKDFTGLQYFSSPNQVISTPFSNHSMFLYGIAPLRQYRPDHFAQCCPGNVHRAMPNFVLRMWMQDRQEAPVASFYGPSELNWRYQGVNIRIEEKTDYPYGEEIFFLFRPDQPLKMPFTFRIPGWCCEASVHLNGRALPFKSKPGGFITLEETWHDGDELKITLSMRPQRYQDRQWQWFEHGPLVYACAVPNRETRERPDRFSPRSFVPTGNWNHVPLPDAQISIVRSGGGYPLDHPPVRLKLKTHRISSYDALAQQRFTPEIPLFYRVGDAVEEIELVPYACTTTRITAFPDAVERIALPIVSARTAGPYPYNYRLPVEDQKFEPEYWNDHEFCDKAAVVQMNPDGYYDLIHHYRNAQNLMAYLQFRIWAETAGHATLAIAVSDGAIGWLNGKKLFTIEPVTSGELMAPFWFEADLRQGYNFLRIKVVDAITPDQFRDSWGAKLEVFRQ